MEASRALSDGHLTPEMTRLQDAGGGEAAFARNGANRARKTKLTATIRARFLYPTVIVRKVDPVLTVKTDPVA